jgi:hypothetical protein
MHLSVFSILFSYLFNDVLQIRRESKSERKQGDAELMRRVLSTNICVDERGEPRSAPLLLGYEPQVKIVPRRPHSPKIRSLRDTTPSTVHCSASNGRATTRLPDHIPTGQVYAMAPPINPFKLMGKTADASSSKKAKGKGKGKSKEASEAPKIRRSFPKKLQPRNQSFSLFPNKNQSPEPPKVHVLEDSEQEEELQPRKKRGRTEPSSIPVEGPSSHAVAWDPALLFGQIRFLFGIPSWTIPMLMSRHKLLMA